MEGGNQEANRIRDGKKGEGSVQGRDKNREEREKELRLYRDTGCKEATGKET